MATIQITQQVSITVSIELPDSKVKSFLENHENLADYLQIDEYKNSDRVKVTSFEIEPPDWEEFEIDSIEKNNGNTYSWDGESLVKD
jgi:hypothetical protein